MPPSKESQALADLYKVIGKNLGSVVGDLALERCIYDQVQQATTETPGVSFETVTGGGRPAIWARPEEASKRHAILFMHGGGYTMGSPNGHRKLAAHLAKACHIPALSVDYRLAPEHPFPAAVDDCVDAYRWLLEQGFDAENIVMAGDSCGGALCTSVPLVARGQGLPLPGAAVALSPWNDLTSSGETYQTNRDNDVLSTADFVEVLVSRFTADNVALRQNPLVSPLFADLQGMPPHWISCGGHDIMCSDGTRLAQNLKTAGVDVVCEVHEGQQHIVEFMAGRAPEADESLRKIGEWVRQKVGA